MAIVERSMRRAFSRCAAGPVSLVRSRVGLTQILSSGPAAYRVREVTVHKSNDPLHGVTLERLLNELVEEFGWRELGRRVPIRCFLFDPSIKSSLTFLRKNPWARTKVEEIYVALRAG